MYASAGILIYGHDAMLLETRRLVLKSAQFRVWTTLEATSAIQILIEEPIDLFILCQSLSSDECEAVLKTAHTLRPDMKNLMLATYNFGVPADGRDTLMTTFLDPARLIELIRDEIKVDAVIALEN